MRLVDIAQQRLLTVLSEGAIAIDATAGNGYDTLFLAQNVGESGKVFSFDIQRQAIEQTKQQLSQNQLDHRTVLIHDGHQNMISHIPQQYRQKISAITFNLGYLPNANSTTTTLPQTTISALAQALDFIAKNGIITVISYRHHTGASAEYDAVEQYLSQLNNLFIEKIVTPGPVLYIITGPDTN